MTTTIMIPTRNRCHDLELTCARLRQLVPPPEEVLICADGCRDGTVAMLRSKFPEFKLLENDVVKGSVYSRDRMLRIARGEVVVSLDDDSFPLERNFLQKLGSVFAEHPEAAVVAFGELRDAGLVAAPTAQQSTGHYVSAYANCAAAMRRASYLALPGFSDFFEHMYEEPDYALQCYSAGAAVWFEPSLVVAHRQSGANRRQLRRHHLNARNELWSVWLRCPWPWLPLVTAYRISRQFVYAASEGLGWAFAEPLWWMAALRGITQCLSHRRAVAWRLYFQWVRLPRNPINSTVQLRRAFPSPGL